MAMTVEEARRVINTTGSSQEDVRAANDVLNAQGTQLGISPSRVYAGQTTSSPATRNYPTGNPELSPTYRQDVGIPGKPYQWASDLTANQLADWLGGEVVSSPGPSSGPYSWPAQNMIEIGGQLFNAGLVADRFDRLAPNMALRAMSEEVASQTGRQWTPPSDSPLWSEAVNQYTSAGSNSNQLAQDLAQGYQRAVGNRNKSVRDRSANRGGGGGASGGGAGYDPGRWDFPVSGDDREFNYDTSPYVPHDPGTRDFPSGFNPYSGGDAGYFDPRRPSNSPRSYAFGAV